MSALGMLLGALCAGLALGACHFGGLWWTVERGVHSSRSAAWFALSALVRMAAVAATFYVVLTRSGLASLVACLAGLLLARAAVTRRIRLKASGGPAV